jgi:hypothetical protein
MGYEPRQPLNKGKEAAAQKPKTNFSGLPTLQEMLARRQAGQHDDPKSC